MSDLAKRHCQACEAGTEPLSADAVKTQMRELSSHWAHSADQITGSFQFGNYYETQAFVNAVAYIAHCEDHHPDITFGYKDCEIRFTTHAINGLSDNDFICAAKIDQLVND